MCIDVRRSILAESVLLRRRRERRTSTGPVGASLDPSAPNAIGNISLIDNDDGTYHVTFNITRAGLYSLSVMHSGYHFKLSPHEFIIRPEVCVCA